MATDGANRKPSDIIQWLVWFAVRPGGLTGGAGRNLSLSEVLGMSLPQLFFIAWDKSPEDAKTSVETKEYVDERYASDPEYREKYRKSVQDMLQQAKDSVSGKK